DGPPEAVVVLGVHDSNRGVGLGSRNECEKAGAVGHRHVLVEYDLTFERMRAERACQQPEFCILGLTCGPPAAVLLSEFLNLVVILSPLVAVERDWRRCSKLRRATHDKWLHVGPLRCNYIGCRNVDTRRSNRSIGIWRRRTVIGARL